MSIALIDYGAGNLYSVANALRAAGADDIVVTADPDVVARADRIVLPGVGAFGASMAALHAVDGMVEAMAARVLADGRPFLGVCVGMQMLADAGTEHGVTAGLGWISGQVEAIAPADARAVLPVRVPHMGWNEVAVTGPGLVQPGEAYFLHGYHFAASAADDVAATTDHGGPLTAAVARGTIIGTQFHPEKSQSYGLAFLARFLAWSP